MQESEKSRDDRDVFRLAPGLDRAVVDTIAARLEFRGTDPGYTALSQAYFDHESVQSAGRILALGCGTGIEVRALRRVTRPAVVLVGLDHSPTLVDVARRLSAEEGLDGNVTFQLGDAHELPYADGEFDCVTMHTLISHVEDPRQVLREARRVVRPGGTVAVFDGDYASLTFGFPDAAVATEVEEELRRVMVANPRVMRDLPRLLPEVGLDLDEAHGVLYADIGSGAFWTNAAEAYSTIMRRSSRLSPALVEEWRAFQASSAQDRTFFAASNYYTYVVRRPD